MVCRLVLQAAVTTADIFLNVQIHVGPVEVRIDLVSSLKLPEVADGPAINILRDDFLKEVSAFWDILTVLIEDQSL
jgi:hypothetical protein